MRILLVEDDRYKSAAIIHWLNSEFRDVAVDLADSYRDGCILALRGTYDFLVLDMALPAHTTFAGNGKDPIVNGGELIIREMLDEDVPFNALILTQYETFNGETIEAIEERLMEFCGDRFWGCISYNSQDDSWKNKLKEIIEYVKGIDS
jgi:ActR/RegA family two-component response regulator